MADILETVGKRLKGIFVVNEYDGAKPDLAVQDVNAAYYLPDHLKANDNRILTEVGVSAKQLKGFPTNGKSALLKAAEIGYQVKNNQLTAEEAKHQLVELNNAYGMELSGKTEAGMLLSDAKSTAKWGFVASTAAFVGTWKGIGSPESFGGKALAFFPKLAISLVAGTVGFLAGGAVGPSVGNKVTGLIGDNMLGRFVGWITGSSHTLATSSDKTMTMLEKAMAVGSAHAEAVNSTSVTPATPAASVVNAPVVTAPAAGATVPAATNTTATTPPPVVVIPPAVTVGNQTNINPLATDPQTTAIEDDKLAHDSVIAGMTGPEALTFQIKALECFAAHYGPKGDDLTAVQDAIAALRAQAGGDKIPNPVTPAMETKDFAVISMADINRMVSGNKPLEEAIMRQATDAGKARLVKNREQLEKFAAKNAAAAKTGIVPEDAGRDKTPGRWDGLKNLKVEDLVILAGKLPGQIREDVAAELTVKLKDLYHQVTDAMDVKDGSVVAKNGINLDALTDQYQETFTALAKVKEMDGKGVVNVPKTPVPANDQVIETQVLPDMSTKNELAKQ